MKNGTKYIVHQANKYFVRRGKMIKLVAIDVDGTLLDSNHKISQMNKEWIKIATNNELHPKS